MRHETAGIRLPKSRHQNTRTTSCCFYLPSAPSFSRHSARPSAFSQSMSDPSHSYPNTNAPPTTAQPPPFETRTSIISFSYDATRTIQWDSSALRYYVKPPPKADLSYGYDRFILHEDKGRIDTLLEAFQRAKNERGTDLSNGVVSWRGVITKYVAIEFVWQV